MSAVQIYEDLTDLMRTVCYELDREWEMKLDYVSPQKLESVVKKIRDWFHNLDLDDLNQLILETFGDLELDDLTDDLPVIIIFFNQDGDQVDIFTGYQDFWSGCPPEWYMVYV